MAEPNVSLTHSRKCSAHSARTGKPCQRYAIKGATVCQTHGGSAPQVKRKAEQRLREWVMPMLTRQHELATQTENLAIAHKATTDILDRSGTGALVQAKVETAKQRGNGSASGITVNIGFLGAPDSSPHITAQVIDTVALPSKPTE